MSKHWISAEDELRLEAERLSTEGATLTGIPKLQIEMFERNFDSPFVVLGQPFGRPGWRQVTAKLRRQERKTQIAALRERMRAARIMASKMPVGASPWDALVAMQEVHRMGGVKIADGLARRFMREACYSVMLTEFAGRPTE